MYRVRALPGKMLLQQGRDLFFGQGLVEKAGNGQFSGLGQVHRVQRGGEHDNDLLLG